MTTRAEAEREMAAEAAQFIAWMLAAVARSQYGTDVVERRFAVPYEMSKFLVLLERSERIHGRDVPEIFYTASDRYQQINAVAKRNWCGYVARAYSIATRRPKEET
ncbi:hypothetical protein [Streptomyces sp. NPDC048157]|uniref:hypothetical protein n=1 Tax=Streptomyces sp. NPDC048157 TaxID=3365503 RepID=UPI00372208BB